VDYAIDGDSGRVKLLNFDLLRTAILANKFPIQDLPDRVRLTYPHGYSTIPEEIQRLTLMIAARELRSRVIQKALISGRDEFKPSLVNVDNDWMKETLDRYTSYRSKTI